MRFSSKAAERYLRFPPYPLVIIFADKANRRIQIVLANQETVNLGQLTANALGTTTR